MKVKTKEACLCYAVSGYIFFVFLGALVLVMCHEAVSVEVFHREHIGAVFFLFACPVMLLMALRQMVLGLTGQCEHATVDKKVAPPPES